MRETVQGVKRVGPRRSNGVVFWVAWWLGCFVRDRRKTAQRCFKSALLLKVATLVGLCDRLEGRHTGRVLACLGFRPSTCAASPVGPSGRDLSLRLTVGAQSRE